MRKLKLLISFLPFLLMLLSCEQPDQAHCACFEQAQKVNRLSNVIWTSGATHQDTLLLKAALQQKDKLCKKLEQSAPEALLDLKKACQ
jgi:hypothetical protein